MLVELYNVSSLDVNCSADVYVRNRNFSVGFLKSHFVAGCASMKMKTSDPGQSGVDSVKRKVARIAQEDRMNKKKLFCKTVLMLVLSGCMSMAAYAEILKKAFFLSVDFLNFGERSDLRFLQICENL